MAPADAAQPCPGLGGRQSPYQAMRRTPACGAWRDGTPRAPGQAGSHGEPSASWSQAGTAHVHGPLCPPQEELWLRLEHRHPFPTRPTWLSSNLVAINVPPTGRRLRERTPHPHRRMGTLEGKPSHSTAGRRALTPAVGKPSAPACPLTPCSSSPPAAAATGAQTCGPHVPVPGQSSTAGGRPQAQSQARTKHHGRDSCRCVISAFTTKRGKCCQF